jgi:cyanophycinase-like exopeptidase
MNGSLALVGSGEYLPVMAEFEKSLLEDGIKNGKENIYIQIPTAAAQESSSRLEYWRDLGQKQAEVIGAKPLFLPIYTRDDAQNMSFVNQISNGALIYMSGGDPHYLAKTLIDTPIWQAIVKNWQSGASLAGCSAGAMVLSSQIPNFRLSRAEPTAGLDLIPNIRVIPHFNKFFKWIPESAAKLLMHVPDDSILIGIDELTAIVKRGGSDFWQVYGQAKLHMLKGSPEAQFSHGQEIRFNGD